MLWKIKSTMSFPDISYIHTYIYIFINHKKWINLLDKKNCMKLITVAQCPLAKINLKKTPRNPWNDTANFETSECKER